MQGFEVLRAEQGLVVQDTGRTHHKPHEEIEPRLVQGQGLEMPEGKNKPEAENMLGDKGRRGNGKGHDKQAALGEAGLHFFEDKEDAGDRRTEGRRHASRRTCGNMDVSGKGEALPDAADKGRRGRTHLYARAFTPKGEGEVQVYKETSPVPS